MRVITANNVNDAFSEAFYWLKAVGHEEDSRAGRVIVARSPVATQYNHPTERVLFNPIRDANPVFHLMEALWMLAGQRNVAWLLPFNSTFDRYAEDNGEVHGAYGYRWRKHFLMDQIHEVIHELRTSPNSRRAVIAMWDPNCDLRADRKDIPCNTHIYFSLRNGNLDMAVACRSNDILWGAYGANVVHMSILQELIAWGVHAPVGKYVQFSNNFHAYLDAPNVKEFLATPPQVVDHYETGVVKPFPLLQGRETAEQFMGDCCNLVAGSTVFFTKFFTEVAYPLKRAYIRRKSGVEYDRFPNDQGVDWFHAFNDWCVRRDDASK